MSPQPPTLISQLQKIGLTATEAQLYIVGLQHGAVSVNELVKQTGVNRATVYHALDTLMEKGLAAKKQSQGALAVTMTPPAQLERVIDLQVQQIEQRRGKVAELLPLLQQQVSTAAGMQVYHYEGITGVKTAVEDALYCKSRHWDILSPLKNFFSEFDRAYADYFLQTRTSRGIVTRSLWEPKDSHAKLTPEQLQERNPRILPAVMHGKFSSVICLYDDKVLVISSLKELSAVIIQSQEFHDTMAAVYEGLWGASVGIRG